jgi:hypothetical protein
MSRCPSQANPPFNYNNLNLCSLLNGIILTGISVLNLGSQLGCPQEVNVSNSADYLLVPLPALKRAVDNASSLALPPGSTTPVNTPITLDEICSFLTLIPPASNFTIEFDSGALNIIPNFFNILPNLGTFFMKPTQYSKACCQLCTQCFSQCQCFPKIPMPESKPILGCISKKFYAIPYNIGLLLSAYGNSGCDLGMQYIVALSTATPSSGKSQAAIYNDLINSISNATFSNTSYIPSIGIPPSVCH